MSVGDILRTDFPNYPGVFTELNPADNPVTTMVGQRGWVIKPQFEYTSTYHTYTTESSANLKVDDATPTYGSTGFTTGSNCNQNWYEAANVSFQRMGDQDLGRVTGWQDGVNITREENPLARAKADAMFKIKSQFEYQVREGAYNVPSRGTTDNFSQRGYRYAPNITNFGAGGAVSGAGTLGTVGTLTRDIVSDGLQTLWENKLWTGQNGITCFTGATGKKQITDLFIDEFNAGKNSVSRREGGIAIEKFRLDWGDVDVVLTHNMPSDTIYFLNLNYMNLTANPVAGKGFFFEKALGAGNERASEGVGIYAQIGMDHGPGEAHARLWGVGSTIVGGQATLNA